MCIPVTGQIQTQRVQCVLNEEKSSALHSNISSRLVDVDRIVMIVNRTFIA